MDQVVALFSDQQSQQSIVHSSIIHKSVEQPTKQHFDKEKYTLVTVSVVVTLIYMYLYFCCFLYKVLHNHWGVIQPQDSNAYILAKLKVIYNTK